MKILQTSPEDSCGWLRYYEYQFALIEESATIKTDLGRIVSTNEEHYHNGFKWSSNE